MRVTDAALLAYTKFRTRVVRTIVVGIMAGLIFTILLVGSFVVTGLGDGLSKYNEEGYGGRYIAAADRAIDFMAIQNEVQTLVKIREKELTDAAKKKGEFNPDYPPQILQQEYDTFQRQAIQKLYPPFSRSQLEEILAPYNHKAIHETRTISATGFGGSSSGGFTPVLEGKELRNTGDSMFGSGQPDSLQMFNFTSHSSAMIEPFAANPETLRTATAELPIVIPMDAALKIAGVKVDKQDQLQTIVDKKQQARDIVLGTTLEVCYRNDTANATLTDAETQAELLERNKDNKDYKKPALIYKLPAEACQPVAIAEDKRTAEEKAAEEKRLKELKTPAPVTKLLKFTIAGFVPSPPDYSMGFDLAFILQTGPTGEFVIPLELAQKDTLLGPLLQSGGGGRFGPPTSEKYFIEFSSRKDHKEFIEDGCTYDFTGSISKCVAEKRYFMAANYGNPRITLEEMVANMMKYGRIGVIVIVAVASFLMMLAISKVIADSRRETGVFRAIGAKRLDIAQIYLTYSAYLATFSFMLAAVIAAGVAWWLTDKFSDRITLQAMESFAVYENPQKIILFGLNPKQLLQVYGIALLAGLLGGLIPITGNLRRNPIKDMRDE